MFYVCSLTSGSSGNSILFSSEKTKILIDSGLSGKKIEEKLNSLGETANYIDGIIITHEHGDHINSAGILGRRYDIPIYIRKKTYEKVKEKFKNTDINIIEKKFEIGDFKIEPYPISHDAIDPIGFIITFKKYRVGILTDTGYITGLIKNKLSDLNGIFLESNYDERLLFESDRPLSLKQRIKSRLGHLSNENAVKLIDDIDKINLKFIVLCHISEKHNEYDLVYKTMKKYIDENKLRVDLYIGKQNIVGEKIYLG